MSGYDYYPAVLYALNHISQGRTITASVDLANISLSTFESYIEKDRQLAQMYDEALRRGYDALADALLNPQLHAVYGSTDPKIMKIYADNIKWYLSKRAHKIYGEKIEIKHEVTLAFAITDELAQASRRIVDLDMRPYLELESPNYRAVLSEPEPTEEELMAELLS